MKKILFVVIAFAALFSMFACSDTETYADQRNRERDSINAFLRNENVKVISEEEFKRRFELKKTNKDEVLTDTSKDNNEYVLFESNGVYMQVIDEGCGNYIEDGQSAEVLVRWDEYNINTRANISDDSWQNGNVYINNSFYTDKMKVTNTSGTFTAMFVNPALSWFAKCNNQSSYSNSISGTVPSGWLVPFSWVKIGRGNSEGESIAHVRLLIPHSYGSTSASSNVNASLYDMTLRRGL